VAALKQAIEACFGPPQEHAADAGTESDDGLGTDLRSSPPAGSVTQTIGQVLAASVIRAASNAPDQAVRRVSTAVTRAGRVEVAALYVVLAAVLVA